MEVLELKQSKKLIKAYIFKKNKNEFPGNTNILIDFLRKKKINFLTLDFDINIEDFKKTQFATLLNELDISYYQFDIPEYALGYLYNEILEIEELFKELVDAYQNMVDIESYKALSLKNWIDMLRDDIIKRENELSLKIRPKWIVKKMFDVINTFNIPIITFIHLVQEDICEDICDEIVSLLRTLNVKVIQYTKKHNIRHITI